MSNELLWILFIFLDFGISIILFRLFKKEGLLAIIVMNIILCNIQVVKFIDIFGMTATLGNLLYGGIFWATDMLSEIYGKKVAQKGMVQGFAALFIMTVVMNFAIFFTPSSFDVMHPHIKAIFSLMPRIAIASLIAYLISQYHDIWAFHFWKEKTGGRHLWLRNNLSTLISQLLDSLIFTLMAFAGTLPFSQLIQIIITTYLLKLIVAIIDTPFIYIGRILAIKMGEYFPENR
ncbi:MAG TPA: VUT family protein [Firmicutes bacterium]|nr:VUT family protein [Bacillota bacterium]